MDERVKESGFMLRSFKMGLLPCAMCGVLSVAGAAKAATIALSTSSGVLLSSLIGNDGTFYNETFHFTSLTGDLPASSITVFAFQGSGATYGENGIEFVAHWLTVGATTKNTTINFSVSVPQGVLIDDDYLATTGGAYNADWSVVETVTNATGANLANMEHLNAANPLDKFADTATFPGQQTLYVTKQITLTGLNSNSVNFISDITQGFSETEGGPVPLPASLVSGSVLLGGLLVAKMRNRRKIV
ncbi:MAG TPA: hypothetical protein VG722_02735 [Tepidisphaeraceae bacterium]|nr:hypothetical protein [Tepidisphaeraceae bacterium]